MWCTRGELGATAGATEGFDGNGARAYVAVHNVGSRPCLVPTSVEVRLTNSQGVMEAQGLGTPPSRATLAIGPSEPAELSLTWIRQGCFTPTVAAAGGYLLWPGPDGSVLLPIAGIPQDTVAPCHGAFGVTDLAR